MTEEVLGSIPIGEIFLAEFILLFSLLKLLLVTLPILYNLGKNQLKVILFDCGKNTQMSMLITLLTLY